MIIIENGHMILELENFAVQVLLIVHFYFSNIIHYVYKTNMEKQINAKNTIPWNYFHAWNSIEFYSKMYTVTINMETLSNMGNVTLLRTH